MLSTKLERFLAKRILIIGLAVAIAAVIFFQQYVTIILGLAVGMVFSILRLNSYVSTFSKLFSKGEEANAAGKVIFRFIINSLMAILILAASVTYDLYFFFGVLSGIFTVPLAIAVNGITEALGITKNNFE